MSVALEPLGFPPYRELSNELLNERIIAAKRELGKKLLILGHHYQQDEVILSDHGIEVFCDCHEEQNEEDPHIIHMRVIMTVIGCRAVMI